MPLVRMRRASLSGPIVSGAGSGAGGTSRFDVVRLAWSAISRLRSVVGPLGARAPARTVHYRCRQLSRQLRHTGLGQRADREWATLRQVPVVRSLFPAVGCQPEQDKRHYLALAFEDEVTPRGQHGHQGHAGLLGPESLDPHRPARPPARQITEAPGRQFFIDPNERGHILMPKANLGPHASLDAA